MGYKSSSLLCICGFFFAGALGAITTPPNNTLVVRCEDEFARMTCASDARSEIEWRYAGKVVIRPPCRANSSAFVAEKRSSYRCNIRVSLADAARDPNVGRISGEYSCNDRTIDGVRETATVIVLSKLSVVHFTIYTTL